MYIRGLVVIVLLCTLPSAIPSSALGQSKSSSSIQKIGTEEPKKSNIPESIKKYVYTFTSGTGFFINNNSVVTNEHVVRNCKTIYLRGGVKPSKARIVQVDKKNDLALLKTKARTKKTAILRVTKPVTEAEDITIIGYPQKSGINGKYLVRHARVVPNDDPFFDKGKMLFTDVVEKGNSGGPVLDKFGNVVGVVVGKVSYHFQDVNSAPDEASRPYKISSVGIDMSTLRKFLDRSGVFYKRIRNVNYSKARKHSVENIAKQFIVNIHCILKD